MCSEIENKKALEHPMCETPLIKLSTERTVSAMFDKTVYVLNNIVCLMFNTKWKYCSHIVQTVDKKRFL